MWISWTNPRSRPTRRLSLVSRPGVLCPGKGADRHCVLPLPPGSWLHVFPLPKPSNRELPSAGSLQLPWGGLTGD